MPLQSGKGKVSANIDEIMSSWKRKGKIGKVKPRNAKHAQQIAAAIAYDKAKGK